jgi:carbon monoxide dehydrogenase subunit G
MEIKVPAFVLNDKEENIHLFLNKMENFQQFLPEDCSDWQNDEDSCEFKIKSSISLKIRKKNISNSEIHFVTEDNPLLPATILFQSLEQGEKTEANIQVKANVNFLMAGMIKPILENLLQNFQKQLQAQFA